MKEQERQPEDEFIVDATLALGGGTLTKEELEAFGEARRKFLAEAALAGTGLALTSLIVPDNAHAAVSQTSRSADSAAELRLRINGATRAMQLEPRVTLLDALRERVGLPGTKKGCDHGQCGACTVLVDGRRVLSCLTLAVMCEGAEITTVEGLARGEELHPVQAAFIQHDGFQCGYCTPGQICSAVGMLAEVAQGTASHVTADVRRSGRVELTDDEIRERMSGNLCRCGAYNGIVAAVREASTNQRKGGTQ